MNELKDLQGIFTAKYNSQAIAKLSFKQVRYMQNPAKVYSVKRKNIVYYMQSGQTADTAVSAFLFGVVYSVSLMPCIGAFLGSAPALAGASGTAVKGALLLVAYSLGPGVSFLLHNLRFLQFCDKFQAFLR